MEDNAGGEAMGGVFFIFIILVEDIFFLFVMLVENLCTPILVFLRAVFFSALQYCNKVNKYLKFSPKTVRIIKISN